MLFHHKSKRIDSNFEISVAGTKINREDSFKFLGLVLDTSLNWSAHIEYIAKKIAGLIGALSRAAYQLHSKTKASVYYAHIHSHLCFMCHLWGAAGSTRLKLLQVLQNKAIRAIFRAEYSNPNIHTQDLLQAHKILPVHKLVDFSAAVATFKIRQGQSRGSINLKLSSNVHAYHTRQCNHIRGSKPRNNWGAASLPVRGVKIYNSLPEGIKVQKTLQSFKAAVKAYLI